MEHKPIERMRGRLLALRGPYLGDGINEGFHRDEFLALLSRLDELEKDAARLLFVRSAMDGIGDHDFHEDAAAHASSFGRAEPNDDDYLAAIRFAIDSAIAKGA